MTTMIEADYTLLQNHGSFSPAVFVEGIGRNGIQERDRERAATVHRLAAIVEELSRGERWVVKVSSPHISLELATGDDAEISRGEDVLKRAVGIFNGLAVKSKPTAPTVHWGGSRPDELKRTYRAAMKSLEAAEDAVAATAPHGRDYPAGEEHYVLARREHEARLRRVADLKHEYEDLFSQVRSQRRSHLDPEEET